MNPVVAIALMILAPVLGLMVLIWLHQLSKLFSYLRQQHPQEYQAMGAPTLVENNTLGTNVALFRFITGSRPGELGDAHLVNWCRFLARFLYVALGIFFVLVLIALTGGIPV